MARSLNTGHPLYGNLKFLVMVDDDNATAREFVTGEPVILDANVTIASGSRGYGVQTYTSGLYTTNSFQLTTNVSMTGASTGTWFFVFNSLTMARKGCRFVDFTSADDAHPMIHGDGVTDNYVKFYDGHFSPRGAAVQLPAGVGVWFSLTAGFTNNSATGGYLRYSDAAISSDLQVSDWAVYSHSVQRPFNINQGAVDCNLFAWALFDKKLSSTESDELYNSVQGNGTFSMLSGGTESARRMLLLNVG